MAGEKQMAQETAHKEVEDEIKPQTSIALITLLPLPLAVVLEVLIGTAFWLIPNSGNAPGWILTVLETICCAPYLASILLAIIGEILYFTVWKTYRKVWVTILIWINPLLIGLHLLILGYIFFELTYGNPFTF